jgi:prophage maintenance system killer protein
MSPGDSEMRGEVIVYEATDGMVRVHVRLERDTVWLSQRQMAELLDTSTDNVSLHLGNIFGEGELAEATTTEDYSVVQTEGRREVRRQVKHYNLDAIISVGYRVNSKRGTQFRIWATRTLREHLVCGYTLNERRLAERGLGDIEQAVGLLARTLTAHALVTDEGRAVLEVVQQYTRAWRLLLEYDEERLAEVPARPVAPGAPLTLDEARAAVAALRGELLTRGEVGALFGQERGDALAGLLGAIEQTFGGEPLYPSAQTRAAHLLYFVIKDHPFGDGNKRIGTLLFLEYLRRNGLLVRTDGSPRLADNAMVALALLVAESDPGQKDLMIRLVLNLLGDEVS